MYPTLLYCRVRGNDNDYYLHNFLTGKEFELEEKHAKILWQCNGSNEISWFEKKFNESRDDLLCFFKTLEDNKLLQLSNSRSPERFAALTEPPYLREVHIDATGWCNLYGYCKHCYAKDYFKKSVENQLTTSEVLQLIDEMRNLNVANCVLSGGEIYTRRDLPEIILRLRANSILLNGIFTNGTIYRDDVVEALKEAKFQTFFFVSLDGHTSELNDFIRGPGNYEKTLSFIKRIQANGFPIIINTVVIEQNVRYLENFCHFLESLGVDRWRLSVPREQGETRINRDLIMPQWDDVFTSYESLLKYTLTRKSSMKMQIGSIFKTELLDDPTYYLFNPDSNCCEYKRWSLVVKPDGTYVPCTAFDNLVLGNFRQIPLRDVWYSELAQAFKTLPINKTDCRDCEIASYCGGGCRKIAWEIHGDVLAIDDNSCPLYKFAFKVAQPLLEAHGIKAQFLERPKPYAFDESIIQKAIVP